MHTSTNRSLIIVAFVFALGIACSTSDAQKNTSATGTTPSAAAAPSPNKTGEEVKPAATPSKNFTPADVAKLKWIEGTWRGMDGDNPFYERYRIEGTAMIVEGLKEDGSPDGEPGRFELKDGEFGKGEGEKRSAASEITDNFVQFVPAVPGKGNNFRFERQSDGTWMAILEWPATADKPARGKVYKMEPWQPKK